MNKPTNETGPAPELYIEAQHWPAKRGQAKPTLVATFDALAEFFYDEAAVVAPADVPGLLEALCLRAATHPDSESDAVTAWADEAQKLAELHEEDSDAE